MEGQTRTWLKVGGNHHSRHPQGAEVNVFIENIEDDYDVDDNELIEALADVLMDRQEKVPELY